MLSVKLIFKHKETRAIRKKSTEDNAALQLPREKFPGKACNSRGKKKAKNSTLAGKTTCKYFCTHFFPVHPQDPQVVSLTSPKIESMADMANTASMKSWVTCI